MTILSNLKFGHNLHNLPDRCTRHMLCKTAVMTLISYHNILNSTYMSHCRRIWKRKKISRKSMSSEVSAIPGMLEISHSIGIGYLFKIQHFIHYIYLYIYNAVDIYIYIYICCQS